MPFKAIRIHGLILDIPHQLGVEVLKNRLAQIKPNAVPDVAQAIAEFRHRQTGHIGQAAAVFQLVRHLGEFVGETGQGEIELRHFVPGQTALADMVQGAMNFSDIIPGQGEPPARILFHCLAVPSAGAVDFAGIMGHG